MVRTKRPTVVNLDVYLLPNEIGTESFSVSPRRCRGHATDEEGVHTQIMAMRNRSTSQGTLLQLPKCRILRIALLV
jgi:hypothetical protein